MDQSILAYVNTNSVEWKEAVPVGLQNGNRVNLSGCFNDAEATAEYALLDLDFDRVRYYSCRHSSNVPAMSLGILGAREWWHGVKFSMPFSRSPLQPAVGLRLGNSNVTRYTIVIIYSKKRGGSREAKGKETINSSLEQNAFGPNARGDARDRWRDKIDLVLVCS